MKLVRYNSVPTVFDDFVDRYFGKSFYNGSSSYIPSVDVAETDKSFEIQLSVPGMGKDDFQLEVKNGQLLFEYLGIFAILQEVLCQVGEALGLSIPTRCTVARQFHGTLD